MKTATRIRLMQMETSLNLSKISLTTNECSRANKRLEDSTLPEIFSKESLFKDQLTER